MANENDQTVDTDIDEEFVDFEDEETTDEDTTDYKAEAEKYKGIAQRQKTKLDKLKASQGEAPAKKETKSDKKPDDMDYGQKAFITSVLGVKGKEEMDLVKDYLAIGKTLDDLADNKHFQNDLKDLRETKATAEAIPSSTKRAGGSARDSVEYWLNKGELPPADQRELRQKVVNAKYAAQKSGNPFAR